MDEYRKKLIEQRDNIREVAKDMEEAHTDAMGISKEIDEAKQELAELYRLAGVEPETVLSDVNEELVRANQLLTIQRSLEELEKDVMGEVNAKVPLLPKLSVLDWTIVGIAGVVAAAVDFLVVRIPKDTIYMREHAQSGSKLTEWIRTFGVDSEGALNNEFLKWCEKVSKTPYDRSTHPELRGIGFGPNTHRLHGLAHDPLFGIIFALLDMFNGSMTVLDKNGLIHVVKTFDPTTTQKVFAPLIWLTHIISDVCTRAGIPIPGWAFLQLAQFGEHGPKDRSVADISRWMYLNGYDLRHFITMGIVPGTIEAIIAAYSLLVKRGEHGDFDALPSKATKEVDNIQQKLHREKMKYLAHSIAVSGNALKVYFSKGNPLAINTAEWVMFVRQSVVLGAAVLRDTTAEKIIRNRETINKEWNKIKDIPINTL